MTAMPQRADRVVPHADLDTHRIITENVPAMLWLGDPVGKCVFLNKAQRDFWGVDLDDVATFDWSSTVHPDDMAALAVPFTRAMEAREPLRAEARYRRADGVWRILRTNASPRFDADGTFLGMTGVNVDVTDQREAEADLRRSTEQLQHALDASKGVGTFVWDVEQDRVFADRNFAAVHGVGGGEAGRMEPYLDGIASEDRDRVQDLIGRVLDEGGTFEIEYRVRTPGHAERWLYSRGSADRKDGRVVRVSGVAIDITARKQQEHQLSLLTRELSHRIKNVFAVVRAMTAAEARADPPAREALDRLQSRFSAMAAAYTHVVPTTGPRDMATGFRDLMATLFAPYNQARPRIAVAGADLQLSSRAATSLALIFHELATNSAKYGALGQDGRVSIDVARDAGDVTFDWRETGGAACSSAPKATGFGTQLIRASVSNLDGTARESWTEHGFRWELRAPATALSA